MILAEPKEDIALFVASLCGLRWPAWRDYTVLGNWLNDKLVGAVVYSRWSDWDVNMHMAGEGNWLTRDFLFAAFDYPFNQVGCRRVTGLVEARNFRARRVDEKLGFKLEGRMLHGCPSGDLLVYGMLRENCRWLNIKRNQENGQTRRTGTA